MKDLFQKGSTLIVLGPGGVGKTTVGAAIALASARSGLDTGVITVDPAQRLRDALGIQRLSSRAVRLDARRLRAADLDPHLRLSAMVLDVKKTWDNLVDRFVTEPSARQRIVENSFYRSLSEQFAGAEAYAALEQLYELHESGRFQIKIVDTPPAEHAFEFIEAPAHLVRLLDSRTAQWLFMPYSASTRRALSIAGRAARFVVDQLETFAGSRAISSIADFFAAAAVASSAISARFHDVQTLLRSPAVGFILVTTPEPDRLAETQELIDRMESQGLILRAVVINRVIDDRTYNALIKAPRRRPAYLEEIGRLRGILKPRDRGSAEVLRFLEEYAASRRHRMTQVTRFAHELGHRVRIVLLPEIDVGVRDLRALAKLSSIINESVPAQSFLRNVAAAFDIVEQPGATAMPRRSAR